MKFHTDLFNYIDVPVMGIHGKQKQSKRTSTYFEFCQAETGSLLCTDVAARGLDIPGKIHNKKSRQARVRKGVECPGGKCQGLNTSVLICHK